MSQVLVGYADDGPDPTKSERHFVAVEAILQNESPKLWMQGLQGILYGARISNDSVKLSVEGSADQDSLIQVVLANTAWQSNRESVTPHKAIDHIRTELGLAKQRHVL